MNYKMFIDESGNTGEPRIKNGKWNYGEQPYFGLGSILIKEEVEKEFSNNILKTLQKYDTGLGTIYELKSKGNYVFKKDLLEEIINLIEQFSCSMYFDISNKKYKVICYLVDYCIYPYYLENRLIEKEEYRTKRRNAANYLYYDLDEALIEQYDCLVREQSEDLNDERIIEFLKILQKEIATKGKEYIVESIVNVIDFLTDNPGIPIENLIPMEDYNNKGKRNFFLPNIDALNNIVVQQGIKRLNSSDTISIIHDEQPQFSNSLTKWIDIQRNEGLKVQIDTFMDSKQSVIIQSVDFLLGTITRFFQKIIDREILSRDERDFVKILKPLVSSNYSKCNIVSVQNEQNEFFNTFGLKTIRTTVPFKVF